MAKTINQMVAKLSKMNSNITKEVEAAIAKGGLRVERDAKLSAPVETGKLRGSIQSQSKGLTAEVGTNVEYAAYQEFGTSKMGAQPFLYPALAANRDTIVKDVQAAIKRGVSK